MKALHRTIRARLVAKLVTAICTAAFLLPMLTPPLARAVWLPVAGTSAFNLTSNWAGGTIDGVFNQTSTDHQIVTLTGSIAVPSLQFLYSGPFNMTLQSSTTTARVLTLSTGITVDTASDGRIVQIGATNANIRLALGDQIQDFTVAGSDELVIFNSITSAGDGGIHKKGTGTLRLEGTSGSYTLGTILTEGTVAVGANTALGVGPITFLGGRLAASGSARTVANNLIFAGDASLGGHGPASLNNSLTFNGNVDVGSATRNVVVTNNVTFAGIVSGSGGLALTTGTTARNITFTAANSFGGNTSIGGLANVLLTGAGSLPDTGALSLLTSSAQLSIAGITAPAETIGSLAGVPQSNVVLGARTLIFGADGTAASYAGTFEGAGGLTKVGAGTQSLTSASTAFTGMTRVESGTLRLTHGSALGANPGTATAALLQIAGGTLQAGASMTLHPNRGVTIGPAAGSGTGTIDVEFTRTLTVEGAITNSGAGQGRLVKTGDGVLRLQTSVNTFTGGISLLGGTLSFGSDSLLGAVPSIASPGHLLIDGSTLLTTQSTTIHANRGIAIGAGGATVDVQTGVLTYGGILEDASTSASGSLSKVGLGSLHLSGVSSYSGATQVAAGTLEVSGQLSGTTSLTVNSGGTFLLSGAETNRVPSVPVASGGRFGFPSGEMGRSETLGSLTLSANAVIDFGSGTANSLQFSNLTSGGFLLAVWNWTGSVYLPGQNDDLLTNPTQDRLFINTLLAPAVLDQIHFYSDAGTTLLGTGAQISFDGGLQVVPVPEPTPATMAGALVIMAIVRHLGRAGARRQTISTRATI